MPQLLPPGPVEEEGSFTIAMVGLRSLVRPLAPRSHTALKLVQAASAARSARIELSNNTLSGQFRARFTSPRRWWTERSLRATFRDPLQAKEGPCRDLALAFLLFDFQEMVFSGPEGSLTVLMREGELECLPSSRLSQYYQLECRAQTALCDNRELTDLLQQRATCGRLKVQLNGRDLPPLHQVALARSFLDTAPPQLQDYTRSEECWIRQRVTVRDPLFLVSQPSGACASLRGAVLQLHDSLEGQSQLMVLKNDVVVEQCPVKFPYGALALVDGGGLQTDLLGLNLTRGQIREDLVREVKSQWRQLMAVIRGSLPLVPKANLAARWSELLVGETSGRRLSLAPYLLMPLLGKAFVALSLVGILWARYRAHDPTSRRGTEPWCRSIQEDLDRLEQEFDRYGRPIRRKT